MTALTFLLAAALSGPLVGVEVANRFEGQVQAGVQEGVRKLHEELSG